MNDASHRDTSDPRPSQRFETETPSRAPDPAPAHRFDSDQASRALTPSDEPDDHLHPDPSAHLGRPRKRRWGLLGVLAGALGLGAAEFVTGLPASLADGDWLTTGWQLLGLGVVGLGGLAILRELWRLRRLGRHNRLREALTHLPECSPERAMTLARHLKTQLDLHDDHPHWQAFLAAREPHHDGQDLAPLLAHYLLAPRDREARRLISRMSGETAVMVAVSPLTLVDMGLVAWRHLAMIDRLCRLYGLELGYAARISLLRDVLRQMAFAGATELASDASMQMLSLDLAGRLSTRAAQGLGVGLLGARLGLRTQRLTRPLAFDEAERPRLTDLRRELWQQLRRLEDKDKPGAR
ncbi:YcjF family protein [Halomonas caseinilytica]|uniref:Putative membrane protein n=1 Tax=Halomonas caseinilytica TaxID=438744 RepID=A0A1M6N3P0_9GAMM|nr:YcjF family protein [Halomonas caseinilytica]SEM50715.1 putative membrane protein [Halomonas caseinilytica]SHJ90282.1 putative membrane protein [Halomonas caseinilytica]